MIERNQRSKRPTMKNTLFKRRSINLDENSYQRGILLAQEKALSLSAMLRILINDVYRCHVNIQQLQDGSRSCLQQQINGD